MNIECGKNNPRRHGLNDEIPFKIVVKHRNLTSHITKIILSKLRHLDF